MKNYRDCNTLYKGVKECRYFSSDLNKWVAINCDDKMFAMNIDLAMYKYQKDIVRFVESKHEHEQDKESQDKFFYTIINSLKNLVKPRYEFYKITGNPEYETATVYNYMTKQTKQIDNMTLKSFLDFEITFENLKSDQSADLDG